MRIAMVAHSNAPWTRYYARDLGRHGHEVKVISFSPDRIPGVDTEFVGIEPFDKYANKGLFLTRVPRVRRLLKRYQPDLVFAPYLFSNGLTAALAWNGPLVVSAVGGDVLEHPDHGTWRTRLGRAIVRFVCSRADRIHTVSSNLDQALVDLGVPRNKLMQIPVGVELDRFQPSPGMPRMHATRIICTRKHEPVYDNETLIRALAVLKEKGRFFHCTFAGAGHLLEKHRLLADELGILDRVAFLGEMPHDRIPRVLRLADIYVSASLSDGTSASLLEAMATGLLPVVTKIDANMPWVTDRENGFLFEAGNVEQLAIALAESTEDEGLRLRAFIENRRLVEKAGDMETNMQRLSTLFGQVLASRRGTASMGRARNESLARA